MDGSAAEESGDRLCESPPTVEANRASGEMASPALAESLSGPVRTARASSAPLPRLDVIVEASRPRHFSEGDTMPPVTRKRSIGLTVGIAGAVVALLAVLVTIGVTSWMPRWVLKLVVAVYAACFFIAVTRSSRLLRDSLFLRL